MVDTALYVVESVQESLVIVIEAQMAALYPDKCKHWAQLEHEFVKFLSPNQLSQLGEKLTRHGLWLKWKCLKREMMNVAGPEWAKLPDLSGNTLDNKLLALRQSLWDLKYTGKPIVPVEKDWCLLKHVMWKLQGPANGDRKSVV